MRLRPERVNHVWSYDFVSAKTYDGRTVRMLNLIDEHSRECLAIHVQRQLKSDDVLAVLPHTDRTALLDPFREHLFQAGIGQISEIFEGDPPHAPRGCIAQAWSVAQLFDIAQACEV